MTEVFGNSLQSTHSLAKAGVQSLVREVKSHKPLVAARGKKKNKKQIEGCVGKYKQ